MLDGGRHRDEVERIARVADVQLRVLFEPSVVVLERRAKNRLAPRMRVKPAFAPRRHDLGRQASVVRLRDEEQSVGVAPDDHGWDEAEQTELEETEGTE